MRTLISDAWPLVSASIRVLGSGFAGFCSFGAAVFAGALGAAAGLTTGFLVVVVTVASWQ